jgi:hypothetical protein
MTSTAQTAREKLIARVNATPLPFLAQVLTVLDAKPNRDEAERLTRAVIIDSIIERCPAADAAFTAWAESDDNAGEVAAIVAAVTGA